MNADEIIKAAPELLKHGAELVGALKLTEIAKAMLGPATSEFAERVKDEIRLYRFGRQLELLKKAEKMVQDAGFIPKAVPIKLLFPLLEGASLEENGDLHTMWAALLANAASPNGHNLRPGFIAILRQMSPDEALILKWIYEGRGRSRYYRGSIKIDRLEKAYLELGFTSETFKTCLEGLEASRLLRRSDSDEYLEDTGQKSRGDGYTRTSRGHEFVTACHAPEPKS